jgi:ParB family chromosome partitioning protein
MRTGLGRGLDVLLGQSSTAAAAAPISGITEVPLERVSPNRQQPRTSFPVQDMERLAASIRRHGVLQPIVVARSADGFELVAGHRRVLASRMAGKTSIPAVIRDDVGDRLELALVENLQREDLNSIDEARAYKLLMETYGLSLDQLAERVQRPKSTVSNAMRSLHASQILQDALTDGKITDGHLKALLPLDMSAAIAALGDIIAKGLSVREAEALARKLAKPRGRHDGRGARNVDPELKATVAELRSALSTKVEIVRGRKGGRITIEFYSDDDFQRLYELLIEAGK